MTKFSLIRIKNAMLFANAIANTIGVVIAVYLGRQFGSQISHDATALGALINMFFIPCSFIIPVIITVFYEKPIRNYMNLKYKGHVVSHALELEARRRLLNEPFFLIVLDICMWLVAAFVYPFAFWMSGDGSEVIHSAFTISLFTGLITVTVAFFVFEHVLQRRVVPLFFPEGGLYATPQTLKIRIRTRLVALLFACNIIPFISVLNTVRSYESQALSSPQVMEQLNEAILINTFIFMGVGIWVTVLVSSNLSNPLREIIRVLRRVRNGDFENRVRVISNDEIGYTGDVINEMNEGLKERDLLKDTFGKYVAREVRDEVLSGRVPLDGEKKDVSILFADLRNFTNMTESSDPKLVIKIMNSYFNKMAEAIQENGGLVLQFIGDEIYAVFGAPISRSDHPDKAFRSGLEMRRRLIRLNEQFEEKGWPVLQHGIGIHTGEALAASIGSPDRLSYMLVGDTVNLASRLQSMTKEMGVDMILSTDTFERLSDSRCFGAEFTMFPRVSVKGRTRLIDIYAVR